MRSSPPPRRGFVHWFGPVFIHDLVRSARRGRLVLVRFLYASLLAAVLLYLFWTGARAFERGPVPAETLSGFVEEFFAVFIAMQYGLAVLLTPAYAAAAITDEKERRTLEYLLATDLTNGEIVLGKLAARVANLLLLTLAGLPILSLIQLLGGVDPNLLLASYVVLGVTVISLAALSVLVSVYARRSRTAVIGAYSAAVLYLLISGAVYVIVLKLLPTEIGLKNMPRTVLFSFPRPVTVATVVHALNAGNPIVIGYRVYEELAAGRALARTLPHFVSIFALFHLLAALVCAAWASARLRAVALRQPAVRGVRTSPRRRGRRLKLGKWPLLWKELYAGRRTRLRTVGQLAIFVLALIVLVMPVVIAVDFTANGTTAQASLTANSGLIETVAVAVAGLSLLAVLVGAAGGVSGERDRQTLDSLLTTPLEARAILAAKWAGSLLRCRWAWLWLAVFALEGLWFDAGAVGDLLLLFPLWLVYAAGFAAVGLWFSVRCRTSLRALFGALFAAAGLCVGHWLLWLCYLPFLLTLPDPGQVAGLLLRIHLGLTPPAVLGWFVASPKQLFGFKDDEATELAVCVAAGIACWVVATGVVWAAALAKFRALTGRTAVRRPEVEAADSMSDADITGLLRSAERRVLWRKRLVIASAVALAVAAPFASHYHVDVLANRELRQAVAEVEARDPRWRFEELQADRTEVPDEQNAADRVLKARRLLPGGWPAKITVTGGTLFLDSVIGETPPEVQLDAHQVRWLRTEIQRAQPALAEARAVADYPRGRYHITWSKDFISTLIPHVQHAREVATLLRLDAALRAQDGDADGAVRSVRATLNTGRSIGDEPMLISLLVRVAIDAVSVSALERALAQGEPSEAELAAVQALLEQEAAEPLLVAAIRGERAMADGMLRRMESGEVALANVAPMFGFKVLPGMDRMGGAALKYSHAWLLRLQSRMLEVAHLPAHERADRLDAIEKESRQAPVLARMITPAITKCAEAAQRGQASLRCAAAAVAAERFRKANGRWPGTLDELVRARLLREVPLDPYDGRPLRLARRDGQLVVYSVGKDLQDDGGNLLANPYEKGADIGFRLWDANRRRQPPRNPEVGPPLPRPEELTEGPVGP